MAWKDYEALYASVPRAKPGVKAVPVIVADPKIGPWTGNQNLGSTRVWDPDALGRQTIFKMPEWGMPQVWTVSLGLDSTGSNWDGVASFDLTAEVVIGVGGTTQLVELDWVAGSCLIVPANAIEVVARLYTDSSNNIYSNPGNIHLSAMVARGSVGVPSATRSFRFAVDNAVGSSATMRIPSFAKWMSVINGSNTGAGQTSAYAATMRYEFLTGSGGNIVTEMYGDMLVNLGGVVPIPATARYFKVWNASAAFCYPVLTFGLAY